MADQQLYKVSDVMARLGVTDQTIRIYAGRYGQFLSEHATPAPGQTRHFTEADVRILTLIRDKSALRNVDVLQAVAAAVEAGQLPDMPEPAMNKAAGAVAVQAARDTWLVERAGLQREMELLQAQIARLQDEYDRERAARVDDLRALAELRERLGRAEGALQAYKETMAAQASPGAPAARDSGGLFGWLKRGGDSGAGSGT